MWLFLLPPPPVQLPSAPIRQMPPPSTGQGHGCFSCCSLRMNTMFTVACLPAVVSYDISCNSRPADALAVDAQDATVLFEGTGSAAGRALQQVANEGAFQRAVYSARRRLQDATVLFEGTGSGTTHRNDWAGWFASGTTASSGDGKRADFD